MDDKQAALARMMDVMADRMIDAVKSSDAPDEIKLNRVSALKLEQKIREARRRRDSKSADRLGKERRKLEEDFLQQRYGAAKS